MRIRDNQAGPTVAQAVRRSVLTAFAGVAIVGVAWAIVALLVDQATLDMSYQGSTAPSAVVVQPPVERSPGSAVQDLVRQHDCWVSAADMPTDMAGRLPGHAVVSTVAEPAPVYSGELVGPALDEVFGQADTGLTVHAFCR
jgi:hypothetical protein